MKQLPDKYVECILTHVDGTQRIGRLNHDQTFWQLSSYDNRRKHNYLWKLEDVDCFLVIEGFVNPKEVET